MDKKFYVTTAIPYVNAAPHIGFAQEVVETDAIARYHRLMGEDVFFLTGTDENAQKNVQAAEKAGVPVTTFVDQNAQLFYKLKKLLNLSFNDFIRTTEKRHFAGAQKLWRNFKKSDVYKKKYRGLYCVGCEAFYEPEDLVGGFCPEHPKDKLEIIEEGNYFFRLSRYEKWLKSLIERDELEIVPGIRKNETLAFIERGLKDFSISRPSKRTKGWGVPVPGDPAQVMYVWVDALSNYITALDYADNGPLFRKYWPADLHVIGKGVNRFHSIYWPAMLQSAHLPIPKEIFVHGYITVEGQKMSKSLGNVISPFEVVEKYGTDAVRYYLLREIPPYHDGDFSYSRFEQLYNADLANGLGNLLARVLALVEKNCGHQVPQIDLNPDSHPLRANQKIYNWKKSWQDIDKLLPQYRFNEALESIWKFISEADRYIDENRPWELAKKDKKKFNWVIYGLLDSLHQVAWQIYPFLPETSLEIADRLGINKLLAVNPLNKDSWTNLKPGTKITFKKPLFPRIK
ncbi:MAG TPA: methionine--tRNA ligase [Candidatus Bathyarchaeia archaeon]|nr:methionine--tRNA ligase [Candidatus Bathyarchaeia archaeon]